MIDNALALAMSEDRGPDSLEKRLRSLMADMALWGYHVHNSIGSEAGWPDWVIVGPRGFIFRELKAERGSVTPDQRRVGNLLMKAGADWAVWKPSDLLTGVIASQLRCIALKEHRSGPTDDQAEREAAPRKLPGKLEHVPGQLALTEED